MIGDSKEEIQMCPNCPHPECINCLSFHEHGGSEAITKKLNKVRKLAGEGLTDAQIAEVMSISRSTVSRWRRRLGIPDYRTRKYGTGTAGV